MKFLSLLLLFILTCVASSSGADRPNILFAISDDQSFPHAGAYGCDWVKTPGFDRVAKMGLLFTRAYTPNAKCAPSRAIILTGRLSWQLEEAVNHQAYFPDKFKTFMEALADADYQTGYTGKGWSPGIAGTLHGIPRELTGPLVEGKTVTSPARGISNKDYAGNFETFLEQRDEDKPFCFWYGGHEPHRAYEYGAGVKKGGKSTSDVDRVPKYWPDNETVRNDMLDYAFEVEYFDKHLHRMLQELERRGLLENTIVMVTSDNGMPFPRSKGQNYEISHHLPLAVSWPAGISNPGRKVDSLVSFIDFVPTFLEAAGFSPSEVGMQPVTGQSLFPIFKNRVSKPGDFREYLLVGKERHDAGRPHNQGYPIRGIIQGDFLFLRNFEPGRWPAGNPETGYLNTDGSPTKTLTLNAGKDPETMRFYTLNFGRREPEEFYNLKTDPDCLNNLAERGDQELKRSMATKMYSDLTMQGDLRMFGKGFIYEQYLFSSPDQQDFYERYMSGEPMQAGWVNQSDFAVQPSEMIENK